MAPMSLTDRTLSLRLGLLFALLLASSAGQLNAAPPPDRDPRIGSSAFVGGSWFQFLGRADQTEERLWLYPHLDGVYEIFREPASAATSPGSNPALAGRPPWKGEFGSVFDPSMSRFRVIFSAPEVLNIMLRFASRDGAAGARARRAARLLELFKALHGGETPYYLRPSEKRAKRLLRDEDRRWIAERLAFYEEATARVAPEKRGKSRASGSGLGTQVFRVDVDALRSADDYYRALVSDGYLDIVVVGGNSYDEASSRVFSQRSIVDLKKELGAQGFRPVIQAGNDDAPNEEKVVRFFGQPIRVRVRASGGDPLSSRVRRTVCYFVEGLAHADVVIYHGHSNRKTGVYYLSEGRTKFSRFKIGMHGQKDLDHKCHGLAQKPYQVLALQSCFSFEKYCLPVEGYYDRELSRRPGIMGNAHYAYFADFVPRYSEFVRLLTQGVGPRELSSRVNAIRPIRETPALLMRGLLQPRGSFIVPKETKIIRFEDRGPKASFQNIGRGDDDREYVSTDLFPQDQPGQIVQVVGYDRGAFGLDAGGRLWHLDPHTQGLAVIVADPKASGSAPFRFIVKADDSRGRPRLTIVDGNGRIRCWRPRRSADNLGRVVVSAYDRKRAGFEPVAVGPIEIGGDADSASHPAFGGCDAAGRFYRWHRTGGWAPVDGEARFGPTVTPHLARDGEIFYAR